MGIYDRDYIRRDGRGMFPLASSGAMCKRLIMANVVVFLFQFFTQFEGGGRWFTDWFLLDPEAVVHGQVWRLVTYAFLHSPTAWMHILFNMLFLWWFGSDVEDIYGPKEFLAFYLAAAVVGGLAFTGWEWIQYERHARDAVAVEIQVPGPSVVPQSVDSPDGEVDPRFFPRTAPYRMHQCLGASGAVTAVLVLCALHFPTRQILISFLFPVPIWLFVLFQVAQDTFFFVSQVSTSTAVVVHLSGALFGFVYYKRQTRLLSAWPDVRGWFRERSRPKLKVYTEERAAAPPVASAPASGQDFDEHLEARLDAVLAKVARSGQASLTDEERRLLFRASEIYKRRRT